MKQSRYIREVRFWGLSVAIGIALGFGLPFAHAWVEPSVAPPGGNVGAPLNTSAVGQVKAGGLVLNTSGAQNGLIVQKGRVGIGTDSPGAGVEEGGAFDANVIMHLKYDPTSGNTSHNQAQLLIEGNEASGDGKDRAVLSLLDVSPGAQGARWTVGIVGTASGSTAGYDSGSFFINRGKGYRGQSSAIGLTLSPRTMNLGIGTANPNYKLTVNGAVGATQFTTTSDIRLKKEISPLDNSLEKIESLYGVSFRWKDEGLSAEKQIGLIAQDVEKVFPEIVNTDASGIKSVSYQSLVAPLINAVKELKAENDQLKARVDLLESREK